MNQNIVKKHLYKKLTISVFWAALLLAITTAVIEFGLEFRRTSAKAVLMLEQLLDTVESTAAIAAYTGNRSIGEDVLSGLMRNDIVHEARLQNDMDLDLKKSRNSSQVGQQAVVRTLYAPFGENEPVGKLILVTEARYSFQEAQHSAMMSASNSFMQIGLTSLIILALVRFYLSAPLRRVSNALHAIRAGEQKRLKSLPRNRDDELGLLTGDINSLLDTLQEKFQQEQTLRRNIQTIEQKLRSIFETTSAGIFLLDRSGSLKTANPTLGKVLGLADIDPQDLLEQKFPEIAFAEPNQIYQMMREAGEEGIVVSKDVELRDKRWVHCLLSRPHIENGSVAYEGVVYDITERRASEAIARYEADYDALTGLLRREAMEREMESLLATIPDTLGALILLLLDLDFFKEINDRYGHDAGDKVLVETATRFRNCVRNNDIVARLGGDEFLIALVNCIPKERAYQIAESIVTAVCQPIRLDEDRHAAVGVSIGIAVRSDPGQDLKMLLKSADQAMYEVKRQGKSGYAMKTDNGDYIVKNFLAESQTPRE